MQYKNKNSTIARQQKSGIKNKTILKILACFKENYKYILITIIFSVIGMYIGEQLGRWLAYGF
ncbi:hypothetical protein [Anaerofustis sp.]|uniref:hypothetical protein n=1 Tax=Anaerofustis sp. TaxID=1872517 RepID=UPI0025B92322|nr:hypothetical protein [Anaerofustis sp.]